MRLIYLLLCCVLITTRSNAQNHISLYQIDLILFAYTEWAPEQHQASASTVIPTQNPQAIPLRFYESHAPARTYQLLANAASPLQRDWTRIQQQPLAHALLHYTWLQPSHNQRPVEITAHLNDGWQVEGSLRVRKSNYYFFDTQLVISPPNRQQQPFVFSQIQRLKPGITYYLDHPEAGMLIRINRIS